MQYIHTIKYVLGVGHSDFFQNSWLEGKNTRRADCKKREQDAFSMSHQNLCKRLLLTSLFTRGENSMRNYFFPSCTNQNLT